MSNKKKNSRVGMGMKPRGSVPQSRTPATVVDEKTPENASADAVQPEGSKMIDSGFSEVGETPNTPVQNLDPSVAEGDPLDELLEKSKDEEIKFGFTGFKELPDVEFTKEGFVDPPQMGLSQGHTPETSTDEVFGPGGKVVAPIIEHGPHGAIGVFSPGADHDDLADAAAIAGLHAGDFDSVFGKRPIIRELGEQPDGTYRMPITIPEGMIEPIRQWAESDGVTPNEWISMRLLEYLECWPQPAQGR